MLARRPFRLDGDRTSSCMAIGRRDRESYPHRVGKTWILRTETKGTGATMVPLETVTKRRSEPEALRVIRKAKPPAPVPAEPRAPRRFRVVDVISRRKLVDDASAGEAIEALRAVRSIVDVSIYVWHPDRGRWRLLTFSEQRAMFDLAAGHHSASGAAP